MASKYAVLIALATVSAVVVDSATRKGDCVGKDCDTDLSGASFVGRSGEISHLETTCTHSKTGALSFAQQQVQQAKTMMVAANKMGDTARKMGDEANKMAQTALDSINSAHRQMASITKGPRNFPADLPSEAVWDAFESLEVDRSAEQDDNPCTNEYNNQECQGREDGTLRIDGAECGRLRSEARAGCVCDAAEGKCVPTDEYVHTGDFLQFARPAGW
ncbi:unnamed protein product [Vitrella brassicaformis CCMP3155]|uniref:Uncharacterized protein n=2 Tax=Vitrella brassicaformis TaxID=1169539 RepID=A0A0G4EHU1_VITBC|nr:unnamed protein product [Vitrella brassicaformis CCMP3155]|eukprot:CEL95555.1 unnamed protein product [Vitrella brassicaformis CCMP3155]